MIIHGQPDAEYRASGRIGIHALLDFARKGPGYFHAKHVAKVLPVGVKAAYQIGRATHALVLEGDERFREMVAIKPETYPAPESNKKDAAIIEKPWNGNANYCKDWEASNAHKTILSIADEGMIINMRNRVNENVHAPKYLKSGCPELVIHQDELGVPLQIRIDWVDTPWPDPMYWDNLIDLKTCDSIDDFNRDMFRYKYDRQAAWYQWIVQQETGDLLPFKLIAVEKYMPHRVAVKWFSERALARAHEMNMHDLERLSQYWQRNEWPAGDQEHEEEVDLPDYLANTYDLG